ncbi:hypothetical protein EBU60_03825 [bacterium]|nr:hypothetical protein [bacterium]
MITVDLPSPAALEAASSAFTFALVGIGAVIVASAIAAATWARSLNTWALGGVSFVLSQTAQVVTLFLFGPLIAAFTSAPLQEASRAIILSTAARGVRSERPSAAFGFGHGAIDLLTSSLIPTLSAVIILGGIRDGSIFVGLDAEVTEKVNAVAIFLASQTLFSAALLVIQGALMLGLHALLTAMVLRVVVRGGGARTIGRGLLLPIAVHSPVAVVRTLFPTMTMPVLLLALLVAALVYRRDQGAMAESTPNQ